MHEVSISRSIADTIRHHAEGRPVERVRVELGQLRQIVPSTLSHCWELVVEGTDLDGVALDVTVVPATIECRACGQRRQLLDAVFVCDACGGDRVAIVSGEEFLISSFDLAEA